VLGNGTTVVLGAGNEIGSGTLSGGCIDHTAGLVAFNPKTQRNLERKTEILTPVGWRLCPHRPHQSAAYDPWTIGLVQQPLDPDGQPDVTQ
jgi:hypothetical protein